MHAAVSAELPSKTSQAIGTLLGFDFGERRIGVAVGDNLVGIAHPLQTIDAESNDIRFAAIAQLITEWKPVGLVVGLPLNLDGTDSPRTQSVRAFARNLAPLALSVLLWDERWSTVAVERAMIEADMSRARRAEKVDAHAAAHILQGAIDALVNLPPSG